MKQQTQGFRPDSTIITRDLTALLVIGQRDWRLRYQDKLNRYLNLTNTQLYLLVVKILSHKR